MAAAPECCQVIDSVGDFQEESLNRFVQQNGVIDARTNYQVVAIMGPQSSGKSTLMNHVFGTGFQEMDAMTGRQQTTKGVWLAKAPKIEDVCTLVLDLEGSDGRERGEDDTNFERQTALLALAVADVLLINVWCHDIGREQGSGKPLMKTIFQVNLKLFAPEPNRRRPVLLFVIRDKSKTPLSKLVEVLSEDVHKMWDTISKPPQYTNSKIDEFFEVQYTALPHYEDKFEDFKADAVMMRRRFTPEDDNTLVHAGDKLPADSLVLSTKNIWGIIKSQKDLNLPAHKVMVANIRCAEIMKDQLHNFNQDQAWCSLKQEADDRLVRDFGTHAGQLLDSCLKGYEVEAMYFDSSVRAEHQEKLLEALQEALEPAFSSQLQLLAAEQLSGYDKDLKVALVERPDGFSSAAQQAAAAALEGFDVKAQEYIVPGASLTADGAREQLSAQIEMYTQKAKQARVDEAVGSTEVTLSKIIAVNAVELLSTFPADLWRQLHAARKQAVSSAHKALTSALSGVVLQTDEEGQLTSRLQAAADKKLSDLLQEAALTRVSKMRDVFNKHFSLDDEGTPRTWRPQENIPALARAARKQAARVLALLAVARGPDYAGGDAVEESVMAMVRKDIAEEDGTSSSSSNSTATLAARARNSFDIATATSWQDVKSADVLVAPHEVRLSWREFMSASSLSVQQAKVTQQANMMAGKRSAPIWAMAAIMFLGWNEFMAVLWNPVLLVVGLVTFVFGYQMYNELDVDAELQRGWAMGAMNIWAKLGDVVKAVMQRNVETVQRLSGNVAESVQQGLHHQGQDSGLVPAYAGAATGAQHTAGMLQHHGAGHNVGHSAAGLKQRPAAARVQDGIEMTQQAGGDE